LLKNYTNYFQSDATSLVVIMPKTAENFTNFMQNMPDLSSFLVNNTVQEMEVWLPQLLAISSLELKPLMQRVSKTQVKI
jgi:hypothetical protein